MKFGFIVGAVGALALSATVATAQVCQGDLSFRGRSTHVGGALAVSDNATSFGGGLSYGHSQGWYGGANAGMITYDNVRDIIIYPETKLQIFLNCKGR